MEIKTLIEQVETEISAMGVVLDDGFTLADLQPLTEAVAKVLKSVNMLWVELKPEEREQAAVDLILRLDDQYKFTEKLAKEFVVWDIPKIPDTVVDLFLNEAVVRGLVRALCAKLVKSVFEKFLRQERTMGARAWKLNSQEG